MVWPVWRVWLSGLATLEEMETWNIVDCLEANECLDVKDDAEYLAHQRAGERSG